MAGPASSDADDGHREATHAEILAPGPVLALVALAVGVGAHLVRPIAPIPPPWHLVGGGVLVVAGFVVLFSGILEMRQIDKSPAHDDEPTALLTDGPFQYTRNPLYLGLLVMYVGVTALLNSLWPLLPFVVLAWYFDRMAKREEEYLEAVFGDEYVEYAQDVRRWL